MPLLFLSSIVTSASNQEQQQPPHSGLVSAMRHLPSPYAAHIVKRLSTYLSPFPALSRSDDDEEQQLELDNFSDSTDCTRSSSTSPYRNVERHSSRTEFTDHVRPHIARAWDLPAGRIEALLVSTTCIDRRPQEDQEYIYVKSDDDWLTLARCLHGVTLRRGGGAESQMIPVDLVLHPASAHIQPDEATLNQAETGVPLPPPSPASTSPYHDSAAYDDPVEEVPNLSSHASASPASGTEFSSRPPPLANAVAAASAGLDLASGIVASLRGLARFASQAAEQRRSAQAAQRHGLSVGGASTDEQQNPASASASAAVPEIDPVALRERIAESRAAVGLSPYDVDYAATTRAEQDGISPSLLAGLSAELAAMRSEAPVSTSSNASPAAAEAPSTFPSRRRRSPSRRTSILSSTLSLLTLFLLLFTILSPASASSLPAGANMRRSPPQHLCKCTCFSTNSTLVPIFAPSDPAKPCLTCTRQFCIDQGLEICKGARIAPTDGDTGTGWEGEVWAKCFERDDYKDRSIILLYLMTILGLLAITAFRGRVRGWYEKYRSAGPRGLYNAVANAPWRTRQ